MTIRELELSDAAGWLVQHRPSGESLRSRFGGRSRPGGTPRRRSAAGLPCSRSRLGPRLRSDGEPVRQTLRSIRSFRRSGWEEGADDE